MCCGQKRSQLQNSPQPSRTQGVPQSLSGNRRSPVPGTQPAAPKLTMSPPHVSTTPTPQGFVAIRYLEASPVRVQGVGTGRRYEFSRSQSVQSVDSRDASALLNTRFFRRA